MRRHVSSAPLVLMMPRLHSASIHISIAQKTNPDTAASQSVMLSSGSTSVPKRCRAPVMPADVESCHAYNLLFAFFLSTSSPNGVSSDDRMIAQLNPAVVARMLEVQGGPVKRLTQFS